MAPEQTKIRTITQIIGFARRLPNTPGSITKVGMATDEALSRGLLDRMTAAAVFFKALLRLGQGPKS